MKRVLCVSPDPNDATSFYRGSGAMSEMRRHTEDIEFIPCPKGMSITWSVLQQADVLFLQRPFTDAHLQMAAMAKQNGLKVWCDWDDDILNIPRSNYTHKIYLRKNARKNVTDLFKFIDMATVSTTHLRYILGNKDNTFVVPNAINTRLFPLESRKDFLKAQGGPLKKKRVFWRGGRTHVEELMFYGETIKQIINEHPDTEFAFCGDTDWPILNTLEGCKNASIFEAKDVIEYHKSFKYYGANIIWVPLLDNEFNQSKSMCAWLEGTYAGCATLGPDFDEWHRDGITNYKDPSDFYDKMTAMIKSPIMCAKLQERSVATIEKDLTLETTAKYRIELLKNILT